VGCPMDEDNGIVNLSSYEGQTLEEVIKSISLEKGVSRIKAIEITYNEIESGRFHLIDVNPPKNYLLFFFSFYNIYFWITIMYLALTFYSITALPQFYPYLYLRYASTILLTLFVPGYLIMDSITPNNYQQETLLKIGLGIIISFLLVSITGYILISSSYGFKESSIMVTLISLTTILSLVWSLTKYLKRKLYNEN
jgi:hypothetical protein